jgi:glycosyltransferase involved in cell wall biosynthesis
VIAEASHAPRRSQGPTRPGHRSVERALAAAHLVVTVNPRDIAGVRSCLRPDSQARVARQVFVPPFIDVRPFAAAGAMRKPNEVPVLLAVGMMRTRDKLESYRVLAKALHFLGNRPWRAVLVGDGPARPEVERLMTPFAGRIEFAGAVPRQALPSYYASADLFVWPAINEAYGMAFLEAQASGLPVVAGCTGGVPAVVADGRTGRLTPIGDVAAFAAAMTDLLDHPQERARLGANAAFRVAARHDDQAAGHLLDCALKSLPFRIPS